MDKIWHRGIIKYLQNIGLALEDIHTLIVVTLGDDAPALSTVKKWAAEFKRDRESLEDSPRSGHPASDRVHHMVMDDRRLTVSGLFYLIACLSSLSKLA